jgi:LAO/AO transport system kinase
MLRQALLKEARAHGLSENELESHASQVADGAEDPYRLVPTLVARMFEARGDKR